jgi:steroid 5-alpha reductase family enzyme
MTTGVAIGVAWAAMAVMMSGLWFVQFKRHNAGIVDIAWSFGTGLSAVFFALTASGDPGRRIVVAVIAGLWGLRLGSALAVRVLSEEEDGRYTMLREKWGDRVQPYMFGFFQIQAAWAVLFALPMLGASSSSRPLGLLDALAVLIWIIAVGGESIADRQLVKFKANPDNKGKVCRHGLWAWSRHPNYFFEWVHWFAYLILAIGSPLLWLAVLGPVVMLVFLTRVTGIPMTEARSVKSRGDAYRDYQKKVSPFFPWPPKKEMES